MWLPLLLASTLLCVHGSDLTSHLVSPAWQDVFSAGGMHDLLGRVKRFVDLDEYQPNIPYQACVLPNGNTGYCKPLHHCVQEASEKDFLKSTDNFCIIKHTAIGVCCPEEIQSLGMGAAPRVGVGGSTALAGDLPAIAPREEEDLSLKINLTGNRGCGRSTRPHVIGSAPANPREWPWMASITREGVILTCGGALITERHVLTAAHCTNRWNSRSLVVRLGEYDFRRSNDSRSYNFRVIEIRQHEDYNFLNYHHDIAILKLHRSAVFNTYVWPICLPPPGQNYVDQSAIIIGWGAEKYLGPGTDVLMEVTVPVWDHQMCVYSFVDTIFDETLCAGSHEGGKDACLGDSGGPLMYQMPSGRWTVIGVVSWGIRCGEPNHPGLYVAVDKYLDWIFKNSQF